jgi:hypothetical protein
MLAFCVYLLLAYFFMINKKRECAGDISTLAGVQIPLRPPLQTLITRTSFSYNLQGEKHPQCPEQPHHGKPNANY